MEAPSAGQTGGEKAWRAVAVVLSLALALGCAILVAAMVDISGTPTCHDISIGKAAIPADGQCFAGSSLQKTISLILGFGASGIAAAAALLAFAFVITGRRGRLMLALSVGAIVLAGLSILIGSV